MNQFTRAVTASGYQIEMPLPLYKLYRRLQMVSASCEIHLYFDEKGNLKSLRKFDVKEEILT